MKTEYTDTYTTTIRNAQRMTACDLFHLMFINYPRPVLFLLQLRNQLIKPLGLQTGDSFTELIQEQNEKYVIFGKPDKHLTFQVQLKCDTPNILTQCQTIQITTSVQFHNTLGKVYFFFIRPFHCMICRILLKRAARNWENKK